MTRCILFGLALAVTMPSAGFAQGTAAATGNELLTTDGHPNLQGIWDYRTMTPLERPAELAGQQFFTDEEASAYRQEGLARRNKDRRASDIGSARDVSNAYNEFWWDYGKTLTADLRTSLIVDPADGRIPYRADRERGRRARGYDGPESRGLWERCLTRSLPRLSGAYNNNFQIIQSAGELI